MKFGYVAISTNNFLKTLDFYIEKLGFKVIFSDEKKVAMLKSGSFQLLVKKKEMKKKIKKNYLHLHMKVKDVDIFFNRLKILKLKATSTPKDTEWGGRTFTLHDPNGIRWEFYQQ